MYKNLEKELKAKGISNNAAAAILGMPEATFRGKMTIEQRSFTIEEATYIKLNLFPELDLFYLFKNEPVEKEDENSESTTT